MFPIKVTVRILNHCKLNKICRRYLGSKVRVRFAPSPTGFLHLGGLRTALYNHLFAKAKNGVTILRIEDTDLARTVPLASENLIEDLAWCGIEYDEGPFFQTERKEIYQKYIQQLLDQGLAYHCFCSNTRLKLLRKETLKAGEIPKYDNSCRNLTKKEVEEKLEAGHSHCVRFKLEEFNDSYNDLVFGKLKYNVSEVEGDPVIMKQDGYPTYHLANVVDDHLMDITHVLRGVEWQISTTKHLLLYRAFKWEPPLFGHLPLLLNANGTKLSKRQGDTQIRALRESGFLPNAVINFIVKFGGGFDIDKKEKDLKSFTFEELLDKFDVSRIKLSSCKITPSELSNSNQLEIKRLLQIEESRRKLITETQDIVERHFLEKGRGLKFRPSEEQAGKVLETMKNRIHKLKDLLSEDFMFLWTAEGKWTDGDETSIEAISKLIKEIENVEWNLTDLKKFLKEFSQKHDLKFPALMKTLRHILSGHQQGPTVAEIMELLGKDDVRLRLSEAVAPGGKQRNIVDSD